MNYTEEQWNTLKRSKRFNTLFEIAMLISNAQSIGKAYHGERPWDKVEPNFRSVYSKAKYLFCDTRAIRDPEIIDYIKNYKINFYETLHRFDQYENLNLTAKTWVHDYIKLSSNLELVPMFSTNSAVIEFLQKNNARKIRIHQQEYWNKTQLRHYGVSADYFVEPSDLNTNDCLIISLPLHGTFSIPEWINDLFTVCTKKEIPVFVDCCWAWLQHNFKLNLNYDCIDTVSCTVGKLFPTEGMHTGFKFVKKENIKKFDLLYSSNKISHQLIIDLMKNFSADYIVKKYSHLQKFWCDKLNLKPTNSVHNAYCNNDLYWYSEHRALSGDGVNQNFFNLIPLFENHDLILKYLKENNMDHADFFESQ
jgi:hypothetical protein